MYERVHYALQFILDLVPTAASNTLFPALVAEFPHITESKNETIAFMRNALRVVEYVPALRQKLLSVIIDRVIKVDIAIQGELESLTNDEANVMENDLLNISAAETSSSSSSSSSESDSGSSGSSGSSSSEEDEDPTPPTRTITKEQKPLHNSLHKLDHMLSLLFTFYTPLLTSPLTSTTTFTHLHSLFHTTILPTTRSRYTQFLIFHAAQQSPLFSDTFCVSLLEKTMDNTRPPRTRIAAAAYIGSYIARARRVTAKQVRVVVSILCRWIAEFISARESECTGPDITKWGVFYAVVQAVMYIFCFRHKELDSLHFRDEDEEEQDNDAVKPRWLDSHLPIVARAIHSRFNPLKCCDVIVVKTFAEVAEREEFVYAWSVVEENRRRGGAGGRLEGYFPFDPVVLRRTGAWVGGSYVEWKGVKEGEESGSDDEEGTEDEEGSGSESEDEEDSE